MSNSTIQENTLVCECGEKVELDPQGDAILISKCECGLFHTAYTIGGEWVLMSEKLVQCESCESFYNALHEPRCPDCN